MDSQRGDTATLIRGRCVVADPARPDTWVVDGAVCVEQNRIAAVGPYAELSVQYPAAQVVGSGEQVVLPGLINAHDHGRGITTQQAGIPDRPVELWMLTLGKLPPVDPYLGAAYAAVQAIESGVTTVLTSYFETPMAAYAANLAAARRAYHEAGLRSVWALSILDRSPVAALCETCLPVVPAELAGRTRAFLAGRPRVAPDEYFAFCRERLAELAAAPDRRSTLLCGPVSVHWCSDELLERLRDFSAATGSGMQTHLLESAYQRRQALDRYGESAIAHLARMDFLGPHLSCAHCVWANERDLDILAAAGVSVVHCPGSNLRLGSGIAPVAHMLAHGVNVALGVDSNGISNEGDMLQEMRLAAHLHPRTGPADARRWLSAATAGGARALMLEREVGRLAAGLKADLILVDLERMESPYAEDAGDDPLPLLLARAEARDVDSVMIDGRWAMRQRRLLTIDKAALVAELRDQVRAALAARGDRSPSVQQELLPYAGELYAAKIGRPGTPFYRVNSKE